MPKESVKEWKMDLENRLSLTKRSSIQCEQNVPVNSLQILQKTTQHTHIFDTKTSSKLENFEGKVIIPIGNSSTKHTKFGLNKQLKFGNFSVDTAFSITYHKIQGQTLERIIIDLNHIPSSRMQIDFSYFLLPSYTI